MDARTESVGGGSWLSSDRTAGLLWFRCGRRPGPRLGQQHAEAEARQVHPPPAALIAKPTEGDEPLSMLASRASSRRQAVASSEEMGMTDDPTARQEGGAAAPVGILCALPQEQALLVAQMGDPPVVPGTAIQARRGTLEGRPVVIAASGVGKVRAAVTATLLVERFGCRALVLSGVAGGLAEDARIGDIVVAERVIDIDYGRLTPEGRIVYQPGVLPIPEQKPDPGYVLPEPLLARVRERLAQLEPDARLGTVLTADAYLASPADRDQLAGEWDGLAIEMEGSALCGVAERFEVPWLVVRALSDRAGEDSLDDFATFVESAAADSARLVQELLPVFD
jgi:adenosylhomocysteine nucleosidase